MAKSIQPWEEKIGSRPTVTVYERAERGLDVYLRWPHGKSYRKRKLTVSSIRDVSGRIDPTLQEAARVEAFAFRRTLLSDAEQVPSAVPSGGKHQKEGSSAPLTLEEGFAIYFHPEKGAFPTQTQHVGDVRRASRLIIRILGGETTWEALSGASYRTLWRTLAREHKARGDHGLNACGKVCAALQAAATFLSDGHITAGCAMPMPKWKAKMTSEWLKITELQVEDITPQTPRFTRHEAGCLLRNLWKADHRIALLIELGAEDRLGQVVRCRRSDLNLETTTEGWGTLSIPGAEKKRGGRNTLTEEQRTRVDAALTTGHLRVLEAAYQSGELEDFPLFPGGPMTRGGWFTVAAASRSCMSKRSMATLLRKLEDIAGVKHVPKRGWYGLRRIMADLAEDVTSDERVLNQITKHVSSDTRRRVYQDSERREVTDMASATKETMRGELTKPSPAEAGTASGEQSSGPKPNPET